MAEDQQKQIQELQMMEQNMTSLAMQKQNIQLQLAEIESALKELEGKDKAYKIIGNILVETDRPALAEELQGKKEIAELRLKTFEKQETKLKDKMQELQNEVMQKLK